MIAISNPYMSTPKGKPLRPAQVKALSALVAGHTVIEAAAIADISRSCLNKWIASDVNFSKQYKDSKSESLDIVSRRLTRLGIKATKVLEDLLDQSENEAIRLRASTETIHLVLKSLEVVEFSQRLDALEAKWQGKVG
jgi:malate synthase